jgi:hypothetical protein
MENLVLGNFSRDNAKKIRYPVRCILGELIQLRSYQNCYAVSDDKIFGEK